MTEYASSNCFDGLLKDLDIMITIRSGKTEMETIIQLSKSLEDYLKVCCSDLVLTEIRQSVVHNLEKTLHTRVTVIESKS